MNHRKTCCGRDFTLVVAGQIISLFGNAILRFALPLYLLKETGSSALLGTVTACALLPMVLLFIVTLMLLYGISGTYQPAVQASIPALVPKDRILWAGAVVNQVGFLANLTGLVFGGMLYGFWGIGSILRVSILCLSCLP